MSLYSLTSTAFDGEVLFEFNDAGILQKFDTSAAQLSEQQQLWILKKMPKHLAHVKMILGDSETATLTELKQDVTFEMFWNRYNEKVRSSKKKAERIWNRLTKTNQVKAFRGIIAYERNIPGGILKKYAETYLGAELWNN
jgi:hypothetical protein